MTNPKDDKTPFEAGSDAESNPAQTDGIEEHNPTAVPQPDNPGEGVHPEGSPEVNESNEKSSSNKTPLIIAAVIVIIVALIAAAGAILAFTSDTSDDSVGGKVARVFASDDDQIRDTTLKFIDLRENFFDEPQDVMEELNNLQCQKDKLTESKLDELKKSPQIEQVKNAPEDQKKQVKDQLKNLREKLDGATIKVDGDTASVDIKDLGTQTFKKEDGRWLLCSSDQPQPAPAPAG